ncbi:NUDIX hydrolase [Propionibacterium freudenreichii]|uniref:NUDIX hydrolase n=1 Tax=Propionibacterium freudenreichii TaxID=1744 RepID=UPI003854908B
MTTQAPDQPPVARFRHEVLAVVFRALAQAGTRLEVMAWRRHRAPFKDEWALPSGPVNAGETMDQAVQRHLAARLDLTSIRYSEQLATFSDPGRDPFERTIASAYLVLLGQSGPVPGGAAEWLDTRALPPMAFDHAAVVQAGIRRLRSKMSYTNIAFALAPDEFTLKELRDVYVGVLGHDVDVTNLGRVLTRRGQIAPTGRRRRSGSGGGRPARSYRFVEAAYEVTDPFATLRPAETPLPGQAAGEGKATR